MAECVTIESFQAMKPHGEKSVVLTAYDYPTGRLVDAAGVDMILVGDTLAMVVMGLDSTRPVTMDAMIHHTTAVRRATERALLLGDMPYEAYHGAPAEAVANGRRFFDEAGVDAIKLEGGREMAPVVEAIVAAGLPLVGHVGLKPQSVTSPDGFKVQGRDAVAAEAIVEDARYLEQAGAFAIVLECIPAQLAEAISSSLTIPTIGIGAGPGCDGQVLVFHDMLGLFDRFLPKFAKKYRDLSETIAEAVEEYRDDVKSLTFPTAEHSFRMKPEEWSKLSERYGWSTEKP